MELYRRNEPTSQIQNQLIQQGSNYSTVTFTEKSSVDNDSQRRTSLINPNGKRKRWDVEFPESTSKLFAGDHKHATKTAENIHTNILHGKSQATCEIANTKNYLTTAGFSTESVLIKMLSPQEFNIQTQLLNAEKEMLKKKYELEKQRLRDLKKDLQRKQQWSNAKVGLWKLAKHDEKHMQVIVDACLEFGRKYLENHATMSAAFFKQLIEELDGGIRIWSTNGSVEH